MAKHMYAMFQEVATKLRSIASENKQLTNKNVNKYLRSSSSENRVPIKQKQGNLTLKCLRYLFTLKKSSSVIVTNKQRNNQLECQILADPQNCIFQPQSTVSSLLTSVKGQGEKKRGKEKWDKTKQNNAQCCGYQDRLGLVFSCVGFPCTSGILPHALVQTVPNCGSGQRCSPSKFPLHNKSASTLIQIFTKTRLSFDPGGTTIILPNEAISAQRNQWLRGFVHTTSETKLVHQWLRGFVHTTSKTKLVHQWLRGHLLNYKTHLHGAVNQDISLKVIK